MSEIIGYARVSTKDQSTDTQIEDLKKLGATQMYSENVSGKATNDRAELKALIDYARQGDTVIVMKLDRLARNTIDALSIAEKLQTKSVKLKIIDIGGDTDINSSTGKLIFTILGAVAEMERKRILERTQRGRESAQANGVQFGRKLTIDRQQVLALNNAGKGATAIAKEMGIARNSVYRIIDDEKLKEV